MYDLIPAVRVPPPVSVSHLVVRVLGPAEEEFQAGYLKAPSHTHLARQKAAMTAAPWSSVVSRSAATMWRLCTWAARWRVRSSASKSSIRRFVITEKAPTRAFSWLKAATTAFTFKTLLRHYANRALTPRSLNVKLGPRLKGPSRGLLRDYKPSDRTF